MVQVKKITLSNSEEKVLGTHEDFIAANERLHSIIRHRNISDAYYTIEYADGFKLNGSIDLEPLSFWEENGSGDNPLTWHLKTFWGNLSKLDKTKKGIYNAKDIEFAEKVVSNYVLEHVEEHHGVIERDTSWVETHHEVVAFITTELNIYDTTVVEPNVIKQTMETQGTGGIYELGERWTNEFELEHAGREWDGEFYDTIEAWLLAKNNLQGIIDEFAKLNDAIKKDIDAGEIDTKKPHEYIIERAPNTGREEEDDITYSLTLTADDTIIGEYPYFNNKAEANEQVELLEKLYDMELTEG